MRLQVYPTLYVERQQHVLVGNIHVHVVLFLREDTLDEVDV